MPEEEGRLGQCMVCNSQQAKACSRCRAVAYCSQAHQASDWSRHKSNCHPVVVAELKGRGRGLVATRQIQKGELVLAEQPAVVVQDGGDLAATGEKVKKQVSSLSPSLSAQFYRLTRKPGVEELAVQLKQAAGTDPEKRLIADKVSANARETAIFLNNDIGADEDTKCLYLSLALTNHSCAPNCAWTCVVEPPNTKKMELRAIRNISPDEEVTVSYTMVECRFSSTLERQKRLNEGWAFPCNCTICTTGEEENARETVRGLQEEMRSLCDTHPDQIDWRSLWQLQNKVVELVESLSCAPILLLRELHSLANLAQLAREKEGVERAVEDWRNIVGAIGVPRAKRELEEAVGKYKEWSANLRQGSGEKAPHQKEVETFLWLM